MQQWQPQRFRHQRMPLRTNLYNRTPPTLTPVSVAVPEFAEEVISLDGWHK
jgi:hypothetical protein